MRQRIYFSGTDVTDVWATKHGRAYLDNAIHMLPFFDWDASPDLAQATWEWPKCRWSTFDAELAGRWNAREFAKVIDREVQGWNRDWEQRGHEEFSRQLYGN